jgi:hypothetical protein
LAAGEVELGVLAEVDVGEEWKRQPQLRAWHVGSKQSLAAVSVAVCQKLEKQRGIGFCSDEALRAVLREIPGKVGGAKRFEAGRHHDAHEFVLALLEALFEGKEDVRDELFGISVRNTVELKRDAVLAAAAAAKASPQTMLVTIA